MCCESIFHDTFSDVLVKRKLYIKRSNGPETGVFCVGILIGFYIEFEFNLII